MSSWNEFQNPNHTSLLQEQWYAPGLSKITALGKVGPVGTNSLCPHRCGIMVVSRRTTGRLLIWAIRGLWLERAREMNSVLPFPAFRPLFVLWPCTMQGLCLMCLVMPVLLWALKTECAFVPGDVKWMFDKDKSMGKSLNAQGISPVTHDYYSPCEFGCLSGVLVSVGTRHTCGIQTCAQAKHPYTQIKFLKIK